MTEFDEDVLNTWYKMARKIVEYKPEATLWDLFHFQMLWEHGEDINKVVEENLITCEDCDELEELHALNMCKKCYQKHLMRKRRLDAVK